LGGANLNCVPLCPEDGHEGTQFGAQVDT